MLKRNLKGFYEIEELNSPSILHGFSTVEMGNMSYKFGDKSEVDKNRAKFAHELGVSLDSIAEMELIHGTEVKEVTRPGVFPGIDGLITNVKDLPLFLMTGDCAPLIFFDPKNQAIGLAHSGWKGTMGKIAVLVILHMMLKYQTAPKDLLVGIGPTIEKCCYKKDVQTWLQDLPEWAGFWGKAEDNKIWIDLNGFTVSQLEKISVARENIFYTNFCTKDHPDLFFSQQSERANLQKPGRFATVVSLI